MAKVYKARIQKSFVKAMGQKPLRDTAHKIMQKKMEKAKAEMMLAFEQHPVTLEVEGGPRANNESGTLGGYGNLFSYIGFHEGSDPVLPLRAFLERKPKVYKTSRFVQGKNSASFTFRLEIPTFGQLEALSKSPWEGRSWIKGVEKGISGLGYYLHSRGMLANSRSGFAIQTESRLRAMTFKPVTYMTSILRRFRKELNMI